MPYPNEHACRLANPDDVKVVGSITKKHEGKEFRILIGKRAGKSGSEEQAYRYPKKSWSAEEARAHCKAHGGSFEAAKENQEFTDEELVDPDFNPFIPFSEVPDPEKEGE
jgi:hypothetical protein